MIAYGTHGAYPPPPQTPLRKKLNVEGSLAAEEMIQEIELDPNNHERKSRIGTELNASMEAQLTKCLRRNKYVFAWTTEDLTGIDPKVMVHKLQVDPRARPVRQKQRPFSPEMNAVIKEEVQRLLEAGHIKEVQYSEWLCNVVLVKKGPGKWRMCNDFTSLNKFCPKDPYPLPRID